MTEKVVVETADKKIEKFLFNNRKVILSAGIVVILAAVVFCVVVAVKDAGTKKGLAVVDSIEYAYSAKAQDLSDADISARQDKALADVAAYLAKGGIVGVRANMLAADIYFAKKDFGSALENYKKAVEAGKKFYTAPICNYNAGVCSEELGKKDDAVAFYKSAADSKDFYLGSHALFNVGRLSEELGKTKEAVEAYKKAVDGYSNDVWANLCQSRIIDLETKGKAE